ncbi:MAG: copper(I)-binding protein/cytochrome oxidase Cu insertion factor (SCO1/SenC/PrrC family) [Arenicella sp.]|jgi:copper(I)-binding protein/cytochrome oxidase Cu insertion factor (SCO1/SenC/PrrC family)
MFKVRLTRWKRLAFAALGVISVLASSHTLMAKESVWGSDYFPNYVLTDHNGKEQRFFDDLIEDKVVIINFIYTTCPDVCPMETAQMGQISRILGDRVGDDVHFITITIDPETDTPAVLKDYRDRFRANWPFYTGDKDQIIDIRRKLGLFVEDIGGGENNHNVNMIIGNQKTGRWMKRTPFENPYVLADQIGNWLHGWKPTVAKKDFAEAPDLRNVSDGENLFRTRCMSCHTLDGTLDSKAIGPDLLAVTINRDRQWLVDWLRNPEKMIKAGDPIAVNLYNRYNKILMPDMNLGKADIADLLEYLDDRTKEIMTARIKNKSSKSDVSTGNFSPVGASSSVASEPTFGRDRDSVAIMNSWVREALPGAGVNAGYMTLFNVSDKDLTITKIESESFASIEIHQMASVDGMMEMSEIKNMLIPAKQSVELKPGGKHLMMMDPDKDFIQGQTVEMSLTFDTGSIQLMTVPVMSK